MMVEVHTRLKRKHTPHHRPSSRHNKSSSSYVQEDEQQFERCKLDGPFLIAQISERNALNGIHRHYNHHHSHVPGMLSVFQPVGNRLKKQQSQRKKCQRTDATLSNVVEYTRIGSSSPLLAKRKKPVPCRTSAAPATVPPTHRY